MFFACYGAGTPKLDQFARQGGKSVREEIAPAGFVARLPRKMLSHPSGGALAVIGHVERAWGYSFLSPDSTAHTNSFEDTVRELMGRARVGWATESLNLRYADKATELAGVLEEESYEDTPKKSPYELAGLWTAHNDARSYVILGDPAVQLPLQGKGHGAHAAPFPASSQVIEVITTPTAEPMPSPPAAESVPTPNAAAPVPTEAAIKQQPAPTAVAPISMGVAVQPDPAPSSKVAEPAPVGAAVETIAAAAVTPVSQTARLDAALAGLADALAQSIERSTARLGSIEAVDLDGFCKLVELARTLSGRGGSR